MEYGVSVISTIKNEEKSIRVFLDSLVEQTRIPDEIILTDGGSADNTCEIITTEFLPKHPYIRLIKEHCNIAKGRNLAIQSAIHPVIAVTDAGCRMDNHWLEELARPLENDSTVDVVGGITIPDAITPFEQVTGAFFTVTPEHIKNNPNLISSRNIAFRKAIWEKVSGYPEWLFLSGEDTLFDRKLQNIGAKIVVTSDAKVYWKPMHNFKRLFKQNFSYARGNGQAGLYKKIFYRILLTYLIFLILGGYGVYYPSNILPFFILTVLAYYSYSAFKISLRLQKYSLFLLCFPIKLVMDVSTILGFINGLALKSTTKAM